MIIPGLPQSPVVVDLTALQNAITLILLSDDRLGKVPVVPEYKLHMESDLMVDAIWTLPRTAFNVTGSLVNAGGGESDSPAPTGAGLLVEMPEAVLQSHAAGPPTKWEVNVVAFEERNVNGNTTGTPPLGIGISSEQLCMYVKDILHQQVIYKFGQLKVENRWLAPAHDWMTIKPGIIANRSSFSCVTGIDQTPRTAVVTFSIVAGKLVLACTDGTATILFTSDGSAPVKSNPAASVYMAPVPITGLPSGTIVQAATWKPGNFIISAINGFVMP